MRQVFSSPPIQRLAVDPDVFVAVDECFVHAVFPRRWREMVSRKIFRAPWLLVGIEIDPQSKTVADVTIEKRRVIEKIARGKNPLAGFVPAVGDVAVGLLESV